MSGRYIQHAEDMVASSAKEEANKHVQQGKSLITC
jgi:hypothetical protein